MALVKCAECGADVSDQAATCPKCGIKLRRGGRRGWIISGSIAGALLLLSGGYSVWGVMAAAEQGARWDAEVARISEAANGAASLVVADDRSSVRMESGGLEACNQAEVAAMYVELLLAYLEPYGLTVEELEVAPGGSTIAGIVVADAERDAPVRCAAEKRATLADSVSRAQLAARTFLDAIGAPGSVASELNGLRGVDGTHTIEAQTAAGLVTVQSRYDGANGLDVMIEREPVGIDWWAPLRAIGP